MKPWSEAGRETAVPGDSDQAIEDRETEHQRLNPGDTGQEASVPRGGCINEA